MRTIFDFPVCCVRDHFFVRSDTKHSQTVNLYRKPNERCGQIRSLRLKTDTSIKDGYYKVYRYGKDGFAIKKFERIGE